MCGKIEIYINHIKNSHTLGIFTDSFRSNNLKTYHNYKPIKNVFV